MRLRQHEVGQDSLTSFWISFLVQLDQRLVLVLREPQRGQTEMSEKKLKNYFAHSERIKLALPQATQRSIYFSQKFSSVESPCQTSSGTHC